MIVEIVRLIFVIAGIIGGYRLTHLLRPPIPGPKVIGIILYIIIGSGLGYVLGGIVGRRLVKIFNWIEAKVQRIPGLDLVIGLAGLVIGLFLATLIFLPLKAIPFAGPYVVVLAYVVLGYLGIRLSLRRKEDFKGIFRLFGFKRFKPPSSLSERILDTSVIIDGRIADICKTGFLGGRLNVPRFVLRELHTVADSDDFLKRSRGRRGLDVLGVLQREPKIEVQILERDFPKPVDVDAKLVQLAKEMNATILTTDYNLNKVAEFQGVRVLNINELANALKPTFMAGEEMSIRIVRGGKEAGQGVGYLDDGTMVVVEEGRRYMSKEVQVTVTGVLQTSAGRMIFAKLKEAEESSV